LKQDLCSNPPSQSVAQYFNSTVTEIVLPDKMKCSDINGDTIYTFNISVPEDVRESYVLQNLSPITYAHIRMVVLKLVLLINKIQI